MTTVSLDISDSIRNLTDFLERDSNVIFAVMFGSAASGKMKKGSDIDLGIYFETPPVGLSLLDLINDLSNLAGRDVHVVVLNSASAFLRHQVMKTKVNLIIRDDIFYRKFREKTITDYQEYKYIAGMGIYDR